MSLVTFGLGLAQFVSKFIQLVAKNNADASSSHTHLFSCTKSFNHADQNSELVAALATGMEI